MINTNVVIDFGNSLIKIGVFQSDELIHKFSSNKILGIIKELQRLLTLHKEVKVVLAGSAPIKLKHLLNKFDISSFAKKNDLLVSVSVLNKEISTDLKIKQSWLKEIGIDLYAIGAYISSLEKNCLVVLMGTANVSLYITKDKELKDVVISSGIGMANALFRKKAELISQEEGLMKVTDKALLKGQQFLANGYLHSSIVFGEEVFKNKKFDIKISGGDSISLVEAKKNTNNYCFIDNLTLRAYNYLFMNLKE